MIHRLELSELPHEILDRILRHVADPDLVCMGRLNAFYREMVIPILTERVSEHMAKDGWRIYVNALCGLVGHHPDWLDQGPDIKLLGDILTIDRDTLELCFTAEPLDEQDGFRPLLAAQAADTRSLRQIVLPVDGPYKVQIELYICQISSSCHRLLQVNNVGDVSFRTQDMVELLRSNPVRYVMGQAKFEPGRAAWIKYRLAMAEEENSIVVEFLEIRTTPDWWLCHISNPNPTLVNLLDLSHFDGR